MAAVLWIGTLVGAVLGSAHAVYLYRTVTAQGPTATEGGSGRLHLQAAYYAIWTVFLWALFGAYVLVLWVISVIAYAVWNLLKP
jgi:glycerol uptake facilitator-like aquaporin